MKNSGAQSLFSDSRSSAVLRVVFLSASHYFLNVLSLAIPGFSFLGSFFFFADPAVLSVASPSASDSLPWL
jgi:hypothetical protein